MPLSPHAVRQIVWGCENADSGNELVSLVNAGGGAVVSTVFGRAGPTVVAQAGDYTAAQVTHAVDTTQSYPSPTWLASVLGSIVSGDISGNAGSINGTIAESQVVGLTSDLAGKLSSLSGQNSSAATVTIPASTTPTARTLATRFGEVFNVMDWGVKGDGSTDDAPAINALITYIAGHVPISAGPRTIYFPAGNYLIKSTLLFAKRVNGTNVAGDPFSGISVIGQGYSTQFTAGTPFAHQEMLRFEDCVDFVIRGFNVKVSNALNSSAGVGATSGSGYVAFGTVALHITAVASGQHVVVSDVDVDCGGNGTYQSGNCQVGLGLSLDYPNDLSEVRCYNVNSKNSSLAAIMIGNATAGNVLDISFFHCSAEHSAVGVFLNAAQMSWYGGTTLSNVITDFFCAGGAAGPNTITGVRSENSGRFWWTFGGGGTNPIVLQSNFVTSFSGKIYTQSGAGTASNYTSGVLWSGLPFGTDTTNTDGRAIIHVSNPFVLSGCTFVHPPAGRQVQFTWSSGGAAAAVYVTCIDTVVETGGSVSSLIGNLFFPGQNVFYNVVNLGSIAGGAVARSPVGNILTDHTAIMGGCLGLNVLASDQYLRVNSSTYGLYQLGGSHRLQAISDPVAPTSVVTAGTPGSTTYYYFVVAIDQAGNKSNPSPGTAITTSNATLGSSNYNVVTWTGVVGAQNYDILRGTTSSAGAAQSCTGGIGVFLFAGSPGAYTAQYTYSPKITVGGSNTGATTFTFNDKSNTTNAYSVPARNGTADSAIDGNLSIGGTISGSMVSGSGAPGTTPSDGALYVDVVNKLLYFRAAGTWVSAATGAAPAQYTPSAYEQVGGL